MARAASSVGILARAGVRRTLADLRSGAGAVFRRTSAIDEGAGASRPSGVEPGRSLIGGRSPADTRPIASPHLLRTIVRSLHRSPKVALCMGSALRCIIIIDEIGEIAGNQAMEELARGAADRDINLSFCKADAA